MAKKKINAPLEMIPVGQLATNTGQIVGLPKNPRFIRDERFEKLKKSIEDAPEMLEMRSLIAVPHEGRYVVVCGNMRLRACRDLGYKELPVYVLPAETPPEKLREYTIKDNVPFGDNEWETLVDEWDTSELEDWGAEIPDEWAATPDDFGEDFTLPDGEKGLAQMTFILSNEQVAFIKASIDAVKNDGQECEKFNNPNENGNALYKITKEWAEQKK